jgi:hypothetical protein
MTTFSVGSVNARVACVFLALGIGGCTAWLAFQLTGAPGTSTMTAAIGFAIGVAPALPRSLIIGVTIDGSGLTIRNYFRTYSVSWADVTVVGWDRVAISNRAAGSYAPALAVRLRSGQIVKARATYGLFATSRRKLVGMVTSYAHNHNVRVELDEADLYFGFRRMKRSHHALTDLRIT